MLYYEFSELPLPNGGRLGLGCCPGHRLTPMAVIPRRGSPNADLARIAAWKPHLLLTFMEVDELAYVGVTAMVLLNTFTEHGVIGCICRSGTWSRRIIDLREPGSICGPGWTWHWRKARGYFCITMLASAHRHVSNPDELWHERP